MALSVRPCLSRHYGFLFPVVSRRYKNSAIKSSFFNMFGSPPTDQEQLDEDEEFGAKFVPLDAENDVGLGESSGDPFGPLAILAVGLLAEEFSALQELLLEIEAHMIALIPADRAAFGKALGDAFIPAVAKEAAEDAGIPAPPLPRHEDPESGTPRVLFLSGMYSSEVVEVVAAVKSLGMPDCIFAAAVPRSWDRNLSELVTDVYGDHEEMKKRILVQAPEEN